MNNKFSLSLVCSALLLTGCGDNSESSGDSTAAPYSDAINQSLARSSKISFTLLGNEADVPLPSFFLFDTNDHTLNIPLDASSTGLLNDPKVAMGEADGWSTIMPFTINVNLPSDRTLKNDVVMNGTTPFSAHLNAGVKVAKVDVDLSTGIMSNFTALTAGVDYLVASSDFKTIQVLPLKGLDPSSDYIYALTDSIVDSADEPLGTSSSYASLKTTDIDQAGSLDLPQKIIHQVEALFAGYGEVSSSDEIIYSSWFTTASAGNVMQNTKNALALGYESTQSQIWQGSANPNNIDADILNSLYEIEIDTASQIPNTMAFDTALSVDPYAKAVLGTDGINALTTNYADLKLTGNEITVYRAKVKLPYFLSNDTANSGWKTQPWRSSMPSVLKILKVLTSGSDADKGEIARQLFVLGITEPATQLLDPNYQKNLVGTELTLADGSQLDPERILTKYSAVPQIRSVESVDVIMFIPSGVLVGNSLPVLQYQHGITSLKETSYAFALQHIAGAIQTGQQPYAIVAIDQPLHGQRGLGQNGEVVTTPNTPTVYMNLEYLPVARDNIRQSAIDGIGLRLALNNGTGAPFSSLDTSNVSLMGHSIGGITGISSSAVANTKIDAKFGITVDDELAYKATTLANPGGGIGPFLLESGSFSGTIKHTVIGAQVTAYQDYYAVNCYNKTPAVDGGDCFDDFYATLSDSNASDEQKQTKSVVDATLTSFTYAAQTVLDNVDPINIATLMSGPVLGIQAEGDETIPNTTQLPTAGTQALFSKLELKNSVNHSTGQLLASYFARTSFAEHSTAIAPQKSHLPTEDDSAAHEEMVSQIVQFNLTQGNATGSLVVNPALLDATID
ncbi:VolA/Pla-1 family phospholipase [Vibrio splendidus]|uniref:VolA/Pla-1 family phospholipase n=1 Tax=Vibrio splendidus TaxID=29497 RepID=UPI000C858834|nr:VolA/Pla-1 family phospholipase [Vibrio splendidus]PMO99043.1 fumarate hydrolyase [Vibrio splendidus]PMP29325.1 fumarate hydrolyase [Vibrio splendidus]PMP31932.1 fumarate hydrolyase [Vibrio splendidus]PMP41300.1 fumarate hydrolyase [Vibrio splendidus]PMP49754.1 fumarate hydrolyase [Vibrio splendidus]